MRRVTVYVPEELFQYLKDRRISMSSWIRAGIRQKKRVYEYQHKKVMGNPALKEKMFNNFRTLQIRQTQEKVNRIRQGIPRAIIQKEEAEKRRKSKKYPYGRNFIKET